MDSRDSSSIEYFTEKYGKDRAKEEFDKYHQGVTRQFTLNGMIEKYGEKEGAKRHKELGARKAGTLENFIKKHGKEKGMALYDSVNKKKASVHTLSYFIQKFGEADGEERYKDKNMRVSPIYNSILFDKEGDHIAAKLAYEEYLNSRQAPENIAKKLSNKFKRMSKGPVSKISNIFFSELSKQIGRELQFGQAKNEIKIFDKETKRYYRYDCYDPLTNTIIEFHGEAFHPKEGDIEWVSPFGADYTSAHNKDKIKQELAEKFGYKYYIVWSKEVSGKSRFRLKIEELSHYLRK